MHGTVGSLPFLGGGRGAVLVAEVSLAASPKLHKDLANTPRPPSMKTRFSARFLHHSYPRPASVPAWTTTHGVGTRDVHSYGPDMVFPPCIHRPLPLVPPPSLEQHFLPLLTERRAAARASSAPEHSQPQQRHRNGQAEPACRFSIEPNQRRV